MAELRESPAIAVVSHNSVEPLRRNLPGYLAAADELASELVVVDNASADGTVGLLRATAARSKRLRTVELATNRGYAAAVNAAFAVSGKRDLMLINPDVELERAEPVSALSAMLESRPRAGVVAPRLVDADGATQPSARRLASIAAMLGSLPAASRVGRLRGAYERYLAPSESDVAQPVGWVIGAAMLIRRAAYDEVGGWDEGFFLYMEDADFCRRLSGAGWEVIYEPAVRLRHGYSRASSSGPGVLRSAARRRHVASLARYWRKHPGAALGGER